MEKEKYLEKVNLFFAEHKKREKKKKIREGKYSFSGKERKNRKGEGGKFLDRENILLVENRGETEKEKV